MAATRIVAQEFRRGATFRGRLTVVTPAGAAKDDIVAVRWALLRRGITAVLTRTLTTGGGISFHGAPTAGVLLLDLPDELTTDIAAGWYEQEWRIEDALGDVQYYRGEVEVLESVVEAA